MSSEKAEDLNHWAIMAAMRSALTDHLYEQTLEIPVAQYQWFGYSPLQVQPNGDEQEEAAEYAQWFQLVDVGLLGEMALIKFEWVDPSTPDLQYVAMINVPNDSPELARAVVQRRMRSLLTRGWREVVITYWLGPKLVLIRRPERHSELLDRTRKELWDEARSDHLATKPDQS